MILQHTYDIEEEQGHEAPCSSPPQITGEAVGTLTGGLTGSRRHSVTTRDFRATGAAEATGT